MFTFSIILQDWTFHKIFINNNNYLLHCEWYRDRSNSKLNRRVEYCSTVEDVAPSPLISLVLHLPTGFDRLFDVLSTRGSGLRIQVRGRIKRRAPKTRLWEFIFYIVSLKFSIGL